MYQSRLTDDNGAALQLQYFSNPKLLVKNIITLLPLNVQGLVGYDVIAPVISFETPFSFFRIGLSVSEELAIIALIAF